MRLARTLPGLVSAALLCACASAPPPRAAGEAPWTSGRISVRVEASPQQIAQSLSAGFDLRAQGDNGELRLNSPLGTRLAAARWSASQAVLETSDGEHRYDSLDALSRQVLGEALPLAALPDWLAARPWPGAASRSIEGGFEQLGWQVLTARRSEGLIEATRAAPPAVSVRVRIDETNP